MGNLNIFWNAAFVFLPFLAPLFAVILLVSDDRREWWGYTVAAFAFTPWLCFLAMLLL